MFMQLLDASATLFIILFFIGVLNYFLETIGELVIGIYESIIDLKKKKERKRWEKEIINNKKVGD